MRFGLVLTLATLAGCVEYDGAPKPGSMGGVDAGTAEVPTACQEGASEQRDCPGGTQTRTCREGVWSPWGGCDTTCEEGAVEEQECMEGLGTQTRECVDEAWSEWSECAVDPESRWRLVLLGADLPQSNEGGGAFDPFNGKPDPKAVVIVSSDDGTEYVVESPGQSDTLNPIWDVVVIDNLEAKHFDYLRIEIVDQDVDWDDEVGACKQFESAPIDFSGALTSCFDSLSASTSITIRYQLEPVE